MTGLPHQEHLNQSGQEPASPLWPSWLPPDGSSGVPHFKPGTRDECSYLAIVACNKCGWADPDEKRVKAATDLLDIARRVFPPRSWVIELPAGMELLNANQRHSWRHKARVTKVLRETAGWAARIAKVPRLERVRIAVEYQPPKLSRSRDGGNWAPSGKACIDGLRDAGVLPEDHSLHVLSETYSIGQPYPRGRLVLTITEVPGGEQ